MSLYRDTCVVLRVQKLGEADRIITLLSQRHGKIRAVAKGVRRTSSRFGARLEPFGHIDVQLLEGRSLDVVSQVEGLDPDVRPPGKRLQVFPLGVEIKIGFKQTPEADEDSGAGDTDGDARFPADLQTTQQVVESGKQEADNGSLAQRAKHGDYESCNRPQPYLVTVGQVRSE